MALIVIRTESGLQLIHSSFFDQLSKPHRVFKLDEQWKKVWTSMDENKREHRYTQIAIGEPRFCIDCGLKNPSEVAYLAGKYKEVDHPIYDDMEDGTQAHDGNITEIVYDYDVQLEIDKAKYCPEPYSNRHNPNPSIKPMSQEQVDELVLKMKNMTTVKEQKENGK